MKKFFPLFLVPLFIFGELVVSEYEKTLIQQVTTAISNAERGISNLCPEILRLEGMSSPKVRHFLNNLCQLPNATYLEIGCWQGSTWISSLWSNENNVIFAYAIDNWSDFGNMQNRFIDNCAKFLNPNKYQLFSVDSFSIDVPSTITRPVNIYFYDGNHSESSHEKAFTYYNEVLDKTFIAVVDDWNSEDVKTGTQKAFKKLNYQVLFEKELPARYNGDCENWWNGLYVAVVRKSD